MTLEDERQIIKREQKGGLLSKITHSFAEKIPGSLAYMERKTKEYDIELKRCIREEVLPDLERKGLLGIHQLEALPKIHRGVYGDIKGATHGGMFLFIGAIKGEMEGEIKTGSSIQFAWRTSNEEKNLIISKIPVDEFVFEVDDEVEIPIVEFHINPFLLIQQAGIMPIRYEAKILPHPNDYLRPKFLDKAVLTLDSKTYQSLPLPTVKA